MSWTSDRKPVAIIWYLPGKGSFISNIPDHAPTPENPAPIVPGALLRCGDMLGVARADRKLEGVPIGVNSVAVDCTFSLSSWAELDVGAIHVWSLDCSQVLEGALAAAAKKDPEGTVRKFMQVEKQYRDQLHPPRKVECQPKKMKRPPGKR